MDQASSDSGVSKSNCTDHPPDNNMAVLQGLTATLAQLAKASETQTAMIASLKEDIILRADSDEGEESEEDKNDTVDINAVVNNMLDSSDSHTNPGTNTAKKTASCPDSGSQDDILDSLTQAFVQSKEKSPAIHRMQIWRTTRPDRVELREVEAS